MLLISVHHNILFLLLGFVAECFQNIPTVFCTKQLCPLDTSHIQQLIITSGTLAEHDTKAETRKDY